ncbi:MAG: hypothetical protein QE271_12155 [Bacteriovoracaceae bacterium]|nr:hypothetical protein [Bacteriovoracaceae bacterium]
MKIIFTHQLILYILIFSLGVSSDEVNGGVNFYHMKEFKRDAILALEETLLDMPTSPEHYRLQILLHKIKRTYGEYTNAEYAEELLTLKMLIEENLSHIPGGDLRDRVERLKLFIEKKLSL